jgi:hypothetical protein
MTHNPSRIKPYFDRILDGLGAMKPWGSREEILELPRQIGMVIGAVKDLALALDVDIDPAPDFGQKRMTEGQRIAEITKKLDEAISGSTPSVPLHHR